MSREIAIEPPPGPVQYRCFLDCEEFVEFVKEARIGFVQLSAGRFRAVSSRLVLPDGAVYRNRTDPLTTYRAAANRDLVYWHAFSACDGALRWNGTVLEEPNATQHAAGDDWARTGRGVEGVSLGLRREPLEAAAAALSGFAPGERKIGRGPLGPSPAARSMASVMRSVGRMMTTTPEAFCAPGAVQATQEELARAAIELLAEQYGEPDERPRAGPDRMRIIRLAEERFEAAGAAPVSLADLCLATGVSARTLWNTFHAVCGVSPLRYFKLRRLGDAHALLRSGRPERGAVKRAALAVGLTELGRFAVEYHTLFGERPSATISRTNGK